MGRQLSSKHGPQRDGGVIMFVVLLAVGGFGGERRPSGAFVSNQGNKSVADHKKIFFFLKSKHATDPSVATTN